MNTKTVERSHSEIQARAQLDSIIEMIEALQKAKTIAAETGREDEIEAAIEAIQNDPLSVEVRSGWSTLDRYAEERETPAEFKILLCAGGPAVRIIGQLENGEPENVHIEHQDWGTQWQGISITGKQGDMVKEYCRQFYFGE